MSALDVLPPEDPRAARRRLWALWGEPRTLPSDRVPGEELGRPVYALEDRAGAEAFAAAEAEVFGNEARVELREAAGWCVIVDLRPQIARQRADDPAELEARSW